MKKTGSNLATKKDIIIAIITYVVLAAAIIFTFTKEDSSASMAVADTSSHTHSWTNETIHHDSTGHYETHVTEIGTKKMWITDTEEWDETVCSACGAHQ